LSPSIDIRDIRQSKGETWCALNSNYQFKTPASICSWRGFVAQKWNSLHTLYYTHIHIFL
jgi:hypothetical protein